MIRRTVFKDIMRVMSTQSLPSLTPEQYLEIERAAETRSEYLDGAMYAMSGASRNHSRIVMAAGAQLYAQLRGRDCTAAIVDLRLSVRQHNLFTYPDVFVTCGPDQYLDNRTDTLTDATLIIEVLSPSTKNYDRGEKFLFYRALPSFREYLLLSQDKIRAEHHVRQPDGAWLMREYSSLSDEIDLASIGCRLRLQDVYERVELL
jgi:Uma2 family endonuclease